MAAATETRREKAAQRPAGSASKPESSGGTNTPKTKRSEGGARRSSGNGRASTNGNGSSGSGSATRSAKASQSRSNGAGRANGSSGSEAKANEGSKGTAAARAGKATARTGKATASAAKGKATAGAAKGKATASAAKGKATSGAGKSKGTSSASKAKSPAKKAVKSTAKKAAKATVNTAVDVAEEGTGLSKPKKFAAKLMLKMLKRSAGKAADGSLANALEIVRLTAEKAVEKGQNAFSSGAKNRLPIQKSVDVAVPLQIAWQEWLELDSLPEGVDTVSDIERDGDTLMGHIDGPRPRQWEAEVIDEREEQSFAWQSHEGSDCAGLVTFHELSERLTRLELNLDVVPTGVGETLKLSTRLADRRAEAELRRFKARVELINPDVYEDELKQRDDDEGRDDGHESDRDETEDRDEARDRGDEDRDSDHDDVEEPDAD